PGGGSDVRGDLLLAHRTCDHRGDRPLRCESGDREVEQRMPALACELLETLDALEIALADRPGPRPKSCAVRERPALAVLAGEEALCERAIRDECDAVVGAQRQQLVNGRAVQEVVLVLQ